MEGPTDPCAETAVTTTRRQSGRATVSGGSVPRAPLPPSALLPHGLFTTRQMLLFGLDNAATSLARTICPDAGTCEEQPLVLPRDMEMQQQDQQVAERSGFP